VLAAGIQSFLSSLTGGTRKTYERNLHTLFTQYPNPTIEDIKAWVNEQRNRVDREGKRCVSESTIKNRLAALKSYLHYHDTIEAQGPCYKPPHHRV
jgi:site-specific recombinase XerC